MKTLFTTENTEYTEKLELMGQFRDAGASCSDDVAQMYVQSLFSLALRVLRGKNLQELHDSIEHPAR